MGKKPDEGGAPAYMGLFTSLMTVLLAFFMLLVALAPTQDAGFHKGTGDVSNSFGAKGGFGMLSFCKFIGEKGLLPFMEEIRDEQGVQGVQKDSQVGEGGGGQTDFDVKEVDSGFYVRILIPEVFERGSARINSKMSNYLKFVGIGFQTGSYDLSVMSLSQDFEGEMDNRLLGIKRASSIMRFLRQSSDVEYSRMNAAAFESASYLKTEKLKTFLEKHKQVSFFNIYVEQEQLQ